MQPISPRHETARKWAAEGIPVFPCQVGGKKPACPHGFHDATTDLEQIDAWWSQEDYNVAFEPEQAGWAIVDIDTSDLSFLASLSLPKTFTVRTPRSGLHLYFSGCLPSKVRPFGENIPIDTRGVGGYVLIPPSIVNGKPYEVADARDIAALPDAFVSRIRGTTEVARAVHDTVELNTPSALALGRSYLATQLELGNIAIEGAGGNNRTFRTLAWLHNLGISPGASVDLLMEGWNDACVPPWSQQELETIAANVTDYAQNDPGSDAILPIPAATLEHLTPQLGDYHYTFPMEDEHEQDTATDPEWLIKDLIQRNTIALMVGQTRHYKSFLALDIALGLATGVSTFGTTPIRNLVVYAAGEGRTGIKKARRRAWRLGRDIKSDTAADLIVTTPPPLMDAAKCQLWVQDLLHKTGGRKPALIIFDTLSRLISGYSENADEVASRFSEFGDSLIAGLDTTILVLHHRSDKPGASDVRGHSAWKANTDSFIEVVADRETRLVTVTATGHRDADEPEHPWIFEMRPVDGTLVPFPMTQQEYYKRKAMGDPWSRGKIGAALEKLGALRASGGVTSFVLAMALTPALEDETAEDRASATEKTKRTLVALAKTKLSSYVDLVGKELRWSVLGAAD